MRIGVNANYFQKPSTGIGVVTIEFMRALSATAEGRMHEWIWYYEGEVPAGHWPENWRFTPVSSWWSRDDVPHRYLWERFSLPRAVARDRCEVLFNLYQSATVLPKSIRHVMLVHDLVPKRFPEYLRNARQHFHYQAIERAISETDRIITPSESTKHDLEVFLKIPEMKVTVAPLGISRNFREVLPIEMRDAILRRFDLKPGYLYHGGGLEARKNTALLLRAYAKVAHSAESASLPLLVVSGTLHAESNPLAAPVRTLVRELGLEDRVRLLGWVPDADLPALYQGAAAFVFPSRYEGFGLPVLEAFASGVPVISTAAGSLAELVGDAGVVVSPDDVDGLGRALVSVSTDAALSAELRRKGAARAAGYDWSHFVSSTVSVLLQ